MGTIKFEVNIPDFDKELNINIIIRKDGEVISTTPLSSTDNIVVEKKKEKKKESKPSSGGSVGGNMMDLNF